MFKYTILTLIILVFLLFFEISLAIPAKKTLEKRVKGISTQIEQIDNYQKDVEAKINER